MPKKKKDSRAEDIKEFAFLVALRDAKYLDEFEWSVIQGLALEDGVIDEAEKIILRGIFDRLDQHHIASETLEDIKNFRHKYGV